MGVQVYERNEWKAKSPEGSPTRLTKSQVNELVVHYSSMDSERRINHSGCLEVVRNIQRYHQVTQGWNDIAYNWLICNHGGAFEGRGWNVMSAATYRHNGHTQAVCFLGGDVKNRDDVRIDGRLALTHVINDFHRKFGANKRIVGHRDRVNTGCPGDEIYSWILADGWRSAKPDVQPWPIPIPKWFWNWAKWRRRRFSYRSRARWMAARPKAHGTPKNRPYTVADIHSIGQ